MEQLSFSLLLFLNNSNSEAQKILSEACTSSLENEFYAINALRNLSCQWLNNLNNGYNFFGKRENTITKLSWKYYDEILNYQVNHILIPYETLITQFEEDIHEQQQWETLTQQVISYSDDEMRYWSGVIMNATELLNTEADLILQFRPQLNTILDSINDDFTTLLIDISNEINQIQNEISSISSQSFFSTMLDIGEVLIGATLSLIGLPTEELVVSGTIGLIDDFFDTLSSAEKISALQDAIVQLQSIAGDLKNAERSFDSVAEFYTSIELNETLPEILPSLYINEIEISTMDASLNQMADRLLQLKDVQLLREQVNQLVAITKQYSQAIINWYVLEMKVQSYEGEYNIAESTSYSLNYLLSNEENQETTYLISFETAVLFKIGATFRILIDMLYVQRQYNYYALSDFSFANYLHFNPSSSNIIYAQTQLYDTILIYLNNQITPNQVTANFTLTAEHNNSTFQQLWETGTAYFVINIPKVSPELASAKDFYYQVNVLNLQANPYPIVNPRFSTINIRLTQLGDNIFYDSHATLWNFTTVAYDYLYTFEASNLCPISSPYLPLGVDYINYSPYGIWKIEIPKNQLDVTSISTIHLYFTLYLSTKSTNHIPLWGFYPHGKQLIPSFTCTPSN